MTNPLDRIRKASDAMDRTLAIDMYASSVAVGVATDDPARKSTGILCIWYDGKLYALHISDLYARTSVNMSEVGTVVLSVMFNAQDNWKAAFAAARREAVKMLGAGMSVEHLKKMAAIRAREVLTGAAVDYPRP